MYTAKKEAEIFEGFDRMTTYKDAKTIFEAAPSNESRLSDFSEAQLRSYAMSLVLTFLANGDYSYTAFEAQAAGIADLDENEELDDDEESEMNDILQASADALISMGADPANVAEFLDGESDEAGAILGEFLSGKTENSTLSDEEIIANYATSGDVILESTIKVIRGGKITLKKKRIGIPKRMNSLQKAALKKARSKAFSGAAKARRKKSMYKREKLGL